MAQTTASRGASGRRVVAITGASAGIGRATAMRLGRDGAAVAICARRADKLHAAAAELAAAGGEPLAVVADVTHERDMDTFVSAARDRFGRLDAIVCNAGFGIYGTIDTLTADQMRELMDVNYMGTFLAARAALKIFTEQNAGHIVIVSSIVGKRGVPYTGAYAATKFAQVGLAECLRAELVGTPIHTSVVLPISTATEFQEVMTKRSGFATRARGPRQSADEVAEAIVRTLDHPRAEVYPHRLSRGLAILSELAPRWTDRLVKRWGRTPIGDA
jgi:short-subunit dehydrogenase